MTLEQTAEVNRLQALMDQRFGDIAVQKGYLTDEQVGKLLKKQGNAYLTFIQTMVDSQLLDMEDVELVVNTFRLINGYSNSEMEDLKSDDPDRIVPLFIPEEGKKFAGIISTAVKTLIRLIDRHVYIGKAEMTSLFPQKDMVSQSLQGEGGFISCLSEGNGALLQVCCKYGQEEFEQLDLDSLDAAGELLNCINGLFASGLSRDGKFLELTPPDYSDVTAKAKTEICKIPVFIGDKKFYFTVAELA
jgi:regulator of RNase E activity RraB